MRKIFKYALGLILLIVLVLLLTFYFVLHTQAGSKWAINYVTSHQLPELKVGSIEGTLAGTLKLNNAIYANENIDVHINQLVYSINDISYLSRALSFDLVSIDSVTVKTASAEEGVKNEGFSGIEIPLDLDFKTVEIKTIDLISNGEIQAFKDIKMNIKAGGSDVDMINLQIAHEQFTVNGSGQLDLTPNLTFELQPSWQIHADGKTIIGAGSVKGDRFQVVATQQVNFTDQTFDGVFQLDAEVDFSHVNPLAEISLKTEKITISTPSDEFTVNSFESHIEGGFEQYSLASTFHVEHPSYQVTEVGLSGLGNLEHLDLKHLVFKNSNAVVNAPSIINWSESAKIETKLQIKQFDPGLMFQEWQGVVDGTVNLQASMATENKIKVEMNDAQIGGTLKGEPFSLIGDAIFKADSLTFKQTQLSLGTNNIEINGVIDQTTLNGQVKVNLPDLSILDDNLKGRIVADIDVKGGHSKPHLNGMILGENINYKSHQIEMIDINANGQLPDQLTLQGKGTNLLSNGESFDQLKFSVTGGLNHHKLIASVENTDLNTSLLLDGKWDQEQFFWTGHITEHELKLSGVGGLWQLDEPVDIEFKEAVKLNKSCWRNKSTEGSVCFDFEMSNNNNQYSSQIELHGFEISTFESFFPNDLTFKGYLEGQAKISVIEDAVSINSDIFLKEGVMIYTQNEEKKLTAEITKASILASQIQQHSEISTEIEFSDGSNLKLLFDVDNNANDELYIEGTIDGHFENSKYLASLSDELKQVSGSFDISGDINGKLADPEIQLVAKQDDGFLILSQTGTKIENLNLLVNKKDQLKFELDGYSGHGAIKVLGTVSFDSEKNWHAEASAKTSEFRLLTLPEIELDISSDLTMEADASGLNITGDVLIPYAHLNIQQLPNTAVSSSPDIIIHKSDQSIEDQNEFFVVFDVNTKIEDTVSVNVLGLNTDMSGELRVNNQDSIVNGKGTLTLNNGQYTIYGQKLDISKGELIFNGPIQNPNINVIASRKSISGDVIAGVELGGTVNQLQSSLYSDPRLSDLETLSYILSGRGLKEDNNTSSEQLLQAALVLGLKKSSPVFSEIQSKLGIDVLTVKEGGNDKDSIVEAGKQFNDKIYVGYNHGLFSRVGFWVLRYKLNKALRLETSQGEDQSVDLIYQRTKK